MKWLFKIVFQPNVPLFHWFVIGSVKMGLKWTRTDVRFAIATHLASLYNKLNLFHENWDSLLNDNFYSFVIDCWSTDFVHSLWKIKQYTCFFFFSCSCKIKVLNIPQLYFIYMMSKRLYINQKEVHRLKTWIWKKLQLITYYCQYAAND